MNFKKRLNGSWVDTSCYIHKTATDTITTLPAVIYADGNNATVGISGNTVQNGTPTPSNPVEVNGVGVRTENLYSGSIKAGGWSGLTGSVPTPNSSADRIGTNAIFAIDNTKTYTVAVFPSTLKVAVMLLGSDNKILSDTGWSASNYQTITDAYGFVASIKKSSGAVISPSECEGIVLIEGSTAPTAYEPYGYKIPISSGQQTTNIYLGSTQTTRQIKKLELTGTENIVQISGNAPFAIYLSDIANTPDRTYTIWRCSHYQAVSTDKAWSSYSSLISRISTTAKQLCFRDTSIATLEDFKTFLVTQYANDTPVTIYYVLATAETTTVNEPLQKIGSYADTLSNATSIPTTDGANSITVDTTVQPSEFTATWTGWHNAKCKEYSYNMTIADWESASISQMENHTIQELQGGNWV